MSLLAKYLKSDKPVLNNTSLSTSQPYISRLARNLFATPISKSFDKTNLDLENSKPNGGPINDPNSGFSHKFLPKNPYINYIKTIR